MSDNKVQPKLKDFTGKTAVFDGIQFVIDEVAGNTVMGHFTLMKGRKEGHSLPPVKLKEHDGTLLNGVTIRTKFKIRYR